MAKMEDNFVYVKSLSLSKTSLVNQTSLDNLRSGKLYELALFIYTLINSTTKVFDLGREIKFADKWDDLIVKEHENGYDQFTFLQIKLIDNSNDSENYIDSKVLLGKRKISLKEDDFKLQKYFISYLRIKDQLKSRDNKSKIKQIIFFSNSQIDINEINRNVGELRTKITNENEIVPNTNKTCTDSKNISYELAKIKDTFLQELRVNLKSDFKKLTEELAKYVMNKQLEIMALDKDYLAYYHSALIDESIIEVTPQQHGKRTIKKGKFTQNFIYNLNLSLRAQNMRNRLIEIFAKNEITAQVLQENMKVAEWTVSDNFDLRQTEDFIFLPNYDITDKDINDFFDILELRLKQRDTKDILSMILNVEIKKTFLDYYDTDPKLVEFLINDFVLSWQSENSTSEKWIFNNERSRFIDDLKIKISKPKAIHKTRERVKYLEQICNTFYLHYDDSCLFDSSYFKHSFVVIKTKSIVLTSVKLIQSLNKMKRHHTILIDLDNLVNQNEILKLVDAFRSDDFRLMIISFTFIENNNTIQELLTQLLILTRKNRTKSVIFVTKSADFHIKKFICIDGYKEYVDKLIDLQYLKNASKILEQKIIIQDQLMRLSDFIDETRTDYNLIDAKLMEEIINNKEFRIGSKPLKLADLEGAYSDLYENINAETLVERLSSSETSKYVYIINGIPGSNTENKFLKCLKAKNVDEIKYCINVLGYKYLDKPINKKIQICDFELKKENFKQICRSNPERKIFWITIKYNGAAAEFMLEQIYNPEFYITGKRFNDEVVFDKSIKKLFVSKKLSESFVVSLKLKKEFETWLELTEKEYEQYKENCLNKQIWFLINNDNDRQLTFEDVIKDSSISQSQTLHLLKFESNYLIWCKTYGPFNNISDHRAMNYNNTTPLLEEGVLIKKIKEEKNVIFTGDPGIGKSTALVKLCETKYISEFGEEESVNESHWLIKINLKDHLHTLKNVNLSTCDKTTLHQEIANFLSQADKNLNSDFAKKLLSVAFKKENFKKPLLILFDGFDEILENSNRHKILSLFNLIKVNTTAKFWVTTRLHFESTLENAISNFAIRIEKMNENQIREFVTKYLLNFISHFFKDGELIKEFYTSKVVKNTKINEYTDAFTSRMQEVFQGDISKFIGTPLQLYLMLAASGKHFVNWFKGNNAQIPDFSYIGNDIWTVYENFVERKYDIYFEKTNTKERLRQQQDQLIFDKYHRSLAKFLILKSSLKTKFEKFKDMFLLAGIIKSHNNKMEFIHPTFREYFAAKEIINWIGKWKQGAINNVINFRKQEYLLEKVLLRPEYKMVRSFLNVNLLKENQENIELKEVYYDKDILFVAAKENLIGIMNFIFRNFEKANVNDYYFLSEFHVPMHFYHHMPVKLPYLHVAVELRHLDMIKYLVKNGANVNSKDKHGVSILHKISRFGCLEMMKFFVEYGADINAVDKNNVSVLQIAIEHNNLDICIFLIENNADINAINKRGISVLFNVVSSKNFKLVKFLIEKGVDTNYINKKAILNNADFSNFGLIEYFVANNVDINFRGYSNRSVLHNAVKYNNLEVIKLLVSHGADVNAKDNLSQTVLHIAAVSSNLDILNFLLKNGADIEAKDNNESTVLHSAAESNKLDKVMFLVSNGVEINAKDINGKTVLHIAAKSGNLEIVEFLISEGADIHAKDENDTSVLHSATESDNFMIVRYLIERGLSVNEKDKYGTSILHLAVGHKNVKMADFLIKKGANVTARRNFDRKTVLHYATDCSRFNHFSFVWKGKGYKIYNNATQIVKLLVLNRADINVKDHTGKSVLLTAAESYNWQSVKFLIEKGAHFNATDKNNRFILRKAIESNNIEMVQFLAEKMSDYVAKDDDGKTALHKAAECGNLDIVKYLLAKGADINARDSNGQSLLHNKTLDFAMVQFLVQAGANISTKDAKNKSVLHYAVSSYNLKIVKYLINAGADINEKDNYGRSVLHKVTYFLPMVKYLLRAGAHVNSVDKDNISVLHKAAMYGDLDIVKFLVTYCADINAKDANNATILHYAVESGNTELVKYFVEKKLDVNAKGKYNDSVLHHAICSKNFSLVKYLIAVGAKVNVKYCNKRTVLFDAVLVSDLSMVKCLINVGANVNLMDKDCKSILHFATDRCDLNIISLLVTNGANVNAKDAKNISILHNAVKSGKIDVVEFLIAKGADVNAKDEISRSILHMAANLHCSTDYLEIIQLLVAKGADVNAEDNECKSVLHYAAKLGKADVVRFIVMHGANVNAKDINSTSVLHNAIESRSLQTINFLIAEGSDVNAKDVNYKSVLHSAVETGNLDLVKSLLAKGACAYIKDSKCRSLLHSAVGIYFNLAIVKYLVNIGLDIDAVDDNNNSVLHYAVYSSNLDLVKYIMESGANINIKGKEDKSILCSAVLARDLDIVKHLIQKHADVNAFDKYGQSILHYACWINDFNIFKLLVAHQANINAVDKNGRSVLYLAIEFGNIEAVEYLIVQGADVNAKDNTNRSVLHNAVTLGNLKIVQLLVTKGAYVNALDNNCKSPLHIATKMGDHAIVTYLLTNLGDIYAIESSNRTVLHNAVESGNQEIVELLIAKGLDVNASDITDKSILHVATETKSDIKLIEFLISNGANINAKDKNGISILHNAVKSGNLKIVELLLEKVSDIDTADENGRTVLYFAASLGYLEMVRLLVAEGADFNAEDKDAKSILQCAEESLNLEMVQFLVKEGATGGSDCKFWLNFRKQFTENNLIGNVR